MNNTSNKTSNKVNISRRDFIKGMGAGAISIGALSMLGGCSNSNGTDKCEPSTNVVNVDWISNEVLEPKAAGVGEMAFVKEVIKDSEIIRIEEIDVLVCGLGPAGFATSIACAEKGLKCVVVEKGTIGTYRSATIGGTKDRIHKKYGVTFDENMYLDDAMVNCSYKCDQRLYQKWLDTNSEAVDWFIDHLGCMDEDFKLTFAAGDFPNFFESYDKTSLSRSWNTSINIPLTPAEIVVKLQEEVVKAGATLLFETPVCQLIKDGEKIVGAIVKSSEGYVRYNTSKGVVLCTGGYEFNLEKLKKSCRPRDLALSGWMNGTNTNTGDGHEMGLAIGAIEDEYPHSLMLDPGQLMPYLRVNKLGRRFTPEYEAYNHLATAIQSQPGAIDFYITDANADKAMDKMWTPSSSCYAPKFVWIGAATSDKALKANTIEELAGLMNVPVDTFKATIDNWNEMCKKQVDSEFHMVGSMMHPIDTAPFYANIEGAESLCTSGGLQITPESEVLDINYKPISGLYAIGNVSGSMFSGTYPHNLNCLSHSRCITFGYNIAKKLTA